jgi:galactose mutarotase-like enzyme
MHEDAIVLHRMENAFLAVEVAPAIGGRLVSLRVRATGQELLWRNAAVPLARCAPGTPYDPHFFGGIDELLPGDLPETIDGLPCPDHGELWTLPLEAAETEGVLTLRGILPICGLTYERRLWLDADHPILHCAYRLTNPTATPRHFLWKLHAALAAQPGDRVECPARWAQPVDLAYSRCATLAPFPWPRADGDDKSLVPATDGTCEFLYLYDLTEGCMSWRSPARGLTFTYEFDPAVFPYAWLFQSFGGLDGHITTVLEPCTSMPIAVNDAAALGQCSVLAPGAELTTTVRVVVEEAGGGGDGMTW